MAAQEGFLSPEHMKRYTTLGMATDQGKLSNTVGQALLAEAQERPIEQVGTTTYRPPYTPVSMSALRAEYRCGLDAHPPHPFGPWHQANGALFMEAADWRRAWFYPRGIEDIVHASRRESFNTRQAVGLSDVSTLGKIDVRGPDAGKLLDLAYINIMSSLKIGKARYGVMLREDGVILDDGTVSRLGEDHFFITTTTAEAAEVMSHLEHLVQVELPRSAGGLNLCDRLLWRHGPGRAAIAVLAAALGDKGATAAELVSNEALPFMGFIRGKSTAALCAFIVSPFRVNWPMRFMPSRARL